MTTLSHDLVSNQRWRHIKVTAGHQENQLTGQTQASPNTFFQTRRIRIRYQGLIQIFPEVWGELLAVSKFNQRLMKDLNLNHQNETGRPTEGPSEQLCPWETLVSAPRDSSRFMKEPACRNACPRSCGSWNCQRRKILFFYPHPRISLLILREREMWEKYPSVASRTCPTGNWTATFWCAGQCSN